jgi:hypothetical protein
MRARKSLRPGRRAAARQGLRGRSGPLAHRPGRPTRPDAAVLAPVFHVELLGPCACLRGSSERPCGKTGVAPTAQQRGPASLTAPAAGATGVARITGRRRCWTHRTGTGPSAALRITLLWLKMGSCGAGRRPWILDPPRSEACHPRTRRLDGGRRGVVPAGLGGCPGLSRRDVSGCDPLWVRGAARTHEPVSASDAAGLRQAGALRSRPASGRGRVCSVQCSSHPHGLRTRHRASPAGLEQAAAELFATPACFESVLSASASSIQWRLQT